MKIKFNWIVLSFFAVLSLGMVKSGEAQSRADDRERICVIPKLKGDKVPFPHCAQANTVFELATDATYVLTGTIENQKNKVFFRIDFESQPWLKTKARLDNPLIEISSQDLTLAQKYEGKLVQMAVVARAERGEFGQAIGRIETTLDLITAPAFFERR